MIANLPTPIAFFGTLLVLRIHLLLSMSSISLRIACPLLTACLLTPTSPANIRLSFSLQGIIHHSSHHCIICILIIIQFPPLSLFFPEEIEKTFQVFRNEEI